MQTNKKGSAPEARRPLNLDCFLRETSGVHLGRIEEPNGSPVRFWMAFDLSLPIPSPSEQTFRLLWIQVTLEPHHVFLATPIEWRERDQFLVIAPRRDREDLDVYASIAVEYGGKPLQVKLGDIARNLFRTFLVSRPH